MGFIKKQLWIRIKGLRFILPVFLVLATMGFSLLTEELRDYDSIVQNDFVKVFLMGYQGSYAVFPASILLIATIPYASQYVIAFKSGSEKYMVARFGSDKFFRNTFIINAILSGAVVAIGMALYLLFSFVFFSHDIDLEFYRQLVSVSAYKMVAEKSIKAYILLIIVHCSVFCAVFSSLGLTISFYIKRRFVAWISPFIIAVILSLFAIFIGITILEPMAILDVSRVSGTTPILIVIYELIVLIAAYMFAIKKYKRDLSEDEEF